MSVVTSADLGVWVDGRSSWIDDSWNKRLNYKEDSLVTNVLLKNLDLQLGLRIEDGVNHFNDIFLRKVTVKNVAMKP